MNYQAILEAVAQKYSTTPDEIAEEMQSAIEAAYASAEPKSKDLQQQIAPGGDCPTPDAFIFQIAGLILTQLNSDLSSHENHLYPSLVS